MPEWILAIIKAHPDKLLDVLSKALDLLQNNPAMQAALIHWLEKP
jgi:hypothetical protein